MDVPTVDLCERLSASLAIIWPTCLEVNSHVCHCTVKHWINFLALEACKALAQSSRLFIQNVAPLQCLNYLIHLDVFKTDVFAALLVVTANASTIIILGSIKQVIFLFCFCNASVIIDGVFRCCLVIPRLLAFLLVFRSTILIFALFVLT